MADHGHHDEEFDLEPVPGLPEAPPAGERILWQGAPDWRALARRCFLSRWTAAALLGLGLVRALRRAADGAPMGEVASLGAWHLVLAAAALGLLSGLAWMTARATVYNITDRRVAMRIGSAVNVTFNLPFRWIDGAELAVHADGAGNIPLTLRGPNTLGYLMLWPHCRPWRMARPQPMLRCIPQAGQVATILADAMRADLARREADGEAGAASGLSPAADRPRAARGGSERPVADAAGFGGAAPVPAE